MEFVLYFLHFRYIHLRKQSFFRIQWLIIRKHQNESNSWQMEKSQYGADEKQGNLFRAKRQVPNLKAMKTWKYRCDNYFEIKSDETKTILQNFCFPYNVRNSSVKDRIWNNVMLFYSSLDRFIVVNLYIFIIFISY